MEVCFLIFLGGEGEFGGVAKVGSAVENVSQLYRFHVNSTYQSVRPVLRLVDDRQTLQQGKSPHRSIGRNEKMLVHQPLLTLLHHFAPRTWDHS
jgi:hypothetical protein